MATSGPSPHDTERRMPASHAFSGATPRWRNETSSPSSATPSSPEVTEDRSLSAQPASGTGLASGGVTCWGTGLGSGGGDAAVSPPPEGDGAETEDDRPGDGK